MRGRLQLRSPRGFTLIESLISLVLLSVVMSAFSMLLGNAVRESGEINEETALQNEVRSSVETLVEDLRTAYMDDSTDAIEVMTASSITFVAPDRAQPFHLRRIAYRISSGYLERSVTTSTDTDGAPWTWPGTAGAYRRQFGSITSTNAFQYLDANGVATTDNSLVRTVVITIRVSPRTSGGVRQFTYQTSVNPRMII